MAKRTTKRNESETEQIHNLSRAISKLGVDIPGELGKISPELCHKKIEILNLLIGPNYFGNKDFINLYGAITPEENGRKFRFRYSEEKPSRKFGPREALIVNFDESKESVYFGEVFNSFGLSKNFRFYGIQRTPEEENCKIFYLPRADEGLARKKKSFEEIERQELTLEELTGNNQELHNGNTRHFEYFCRGLAKGTQFILREYEDYLEKKNREKKQLDQDLRHLRAAAGLGVQGKRM